MDFAILNFVAVAKNINKLFKLKLRPTQDEKEKARIRLLQTKPEEERREAEQLQNKQG